MTREELRKKSGSETKYIEPKKLLIKEVDTQQFSDSGLSKEIIELITPYPKKRGWPKKMWWEEINVIMNPRDLRASKANVHKCLWQRYYQRYVSFHWTSN